MVEKNSITKVAFTGNTKLTFNGIRAINTLDNFDIKAVFGIKDSDSHKKVNYLSLDKFCLDEDIKLFKNNDWLDFHNFCEKREVDLIITLGD